MLRKQTAPRNFYTVSSLSANWHDIFTLDGLFKYTFPNLLSQIVFEKNNEQKELKQCFFSKRNRNNKILDKWISNRKKRWQKIYIRNNKDTSNNRNKEKKKNTVFPLFTLFKLKYRCGLPFVNVFLCFLLRLYLFLTWCFYFCIYKFYMICIICIIIIVLSFGFFLFYLICESQKE